jgi:hypothetical protein
MAVGIGLSVRNSVGVIEAILGIKSEFVRTPKYKVESGAKKSGEWLKKKYHNRAGLMPFAEVLLGAYFATATIYAIQNENYATVPFFVLFVWGYFYTGFMSLGQTYIDRLRFLRGSHATHQPSLLGSGVLRFTPLAEVRFDSEPSAPIAASSEIGAISAD